MSFLRRFALPRRTLLRGAAGGAAVTLALPPLEAMFDANGTAYAADGKPIPRRLGVWFWGNGVRPRQWLPRSEGADWIPSDELAPLAPIKEYVSVVSGTGVKLDGTVHHVGRAGMLCGAYNPSAGTYGSPDGPSIDQVAAQAWRGKTAFPSLTIGVSMRAKGGVGAVRARGGSSWAGPGQSLPAEYSPSALWKRLFANALPSEGDPERAKALAFRKSIIDLVAADARDLQARLGAEDRRRVDHHLAGLRSIESALALPPPTTCAPPKTAPADPAVDLGHELLAERNKLLADLLATALACDLTRAFSYEYMGMQADTIFWQVGATEGCHVMTHDDRGLDTKLAPQYEKIHGVVLFLMGELRYLLQKLKSIPEGAGNLLDSCCILATSDVNDGTAHSKSDMPILVAGRAGGLRSGVHYRSKSGESASKVLLTCLRAAGVEAPSFGKGAGLATEGIGALGP
jgi:hypothetical protein